MRIAFDHVQITITDKSISYRAFSLLLGGQRFERVRNLLVCYAGVNGKSFHLQRRCESIKTCHIP